MSEVIQFPERKPDKMSIEEACRMMCSETAVAQRYPQGVQERAIQNVLAVCDRWWSPTISISLTPQVDFTEQQFAEVKRLIQSAGEEAYKTLKMHAVSERLLHELEIESRRSRPRSA